MKRRRKILFLSLYFIFLAVLSEGGARLGLWIYFERHPAPGDHELSWRHYWIERHQKSGNDIYYEFDVYDASKGWISKPDIRDMQVFGDKVLNTNAHGFRGKKDYSYSNNPEKIRIVILGDSFTFGDEVSDHETYSYYLQEMIPQAEIINLGVHGYGHDQMLILLGEEGIRYSPDLIILGFLPIDMSRNVLNFRDFAKPKFVLDGEALRLTGSPVPTPEEVLKWDWIRPRVIDAFSGVRHMLGKRTGAYDRELSTITAAILTRIIDMAESTQAVPVFVYLPYGSEISTDASRNAGEDHFFSMCDADTRVHCFSARPRFAEKLIQGVDFDTEGHWGPAGHLAVAEAIEHYLLGQGHLDLPGNFDNTADSQLD
jgi:hypothetical protein